MRLPLCLPQEIFAGSRTALAGIDILRKVKGGCMHTAIITCWPCIRLHTDCARAACWRLVHTCSAAPPSLLRSLQPLLKLCASAHFLHFLQICNHPDLLERAKWEAAEVRPHQQRFRGS